MSAVKLSPQGTAAEQLVLIITIFNGEYITPADYRLIIFLCVPCGDLYYFRVLPWMPWPFIIQNITFSFHDIRNSQVYSSGMTDDPQIVLCTVPDEAAAKQIASTLVAEQLAACVNIVPGITSVYRWKGAIETAAELLLIIKTTMTVYTRLQDRIRALHPYELPEVIAISLDQGLPDYLAWIRTSLE
jgi:periplasmic divalent cation tolerance protein